MSRNSFGNRAFLSTVAAEFEPSPLASALLQPQLPDADLQQKRPLVSQSTLSGTITSSRHLPVSCPGCGALTQDVDSGSAGHYTLSRKAVKTYLRDLRREVQLPDEADEGHKESDRAVRSQSQDEDNSTHAGTLTEAARRSASLVCDRCHYLIHDSRGVPIAHPSIEAIADSIAESPFNRNHVYHVVDAADFPMSVVPSIYKHLSLAKPRSQNRRSQHSFSSRPSLSFIITRSDLLAPTKEMVDSMMPKFSAVLRTALGRTGRTLRLGNLHLVSSKRGWWTKDIKDTIRSRGGGNWLVGKFNVGKSNLFEVLFPKGSHDRTPVYAELQKQQGLEAVQKSSDTSFFSEKSLLPPAQPEVPFPTMPLVSSLPGTTASPIRLPFGNNKGELIDMPGLQRGGIDQYVKDQDKTDLVMVSRPTVSQHVLKHGQSLLLGGGLVRVTPVLDEHDHGTTFQAYPFVPLKAHVTATVKAEGTQTQQRESGIESILAEEAGAAILSAGRFKLQTDVTKSRAGPMIRAGVSADKLPFHVYATDILIEGVGWIEIVCQVRKSKHAPQADLAGMDASQLGEAEPTVPSAEGLSIETSAFTPFGGDIATHDAIPVSASNFPEVEIFTPNGKYVGQRSCLDIWQMWNSGKAQKASTAARPRKSMSGARKREKAPRDFAAKNGT